MTHKLGPDTSNVVVNLRTTEKALLSREACERGISLGALFRYCVARTMESESPEVAARIREARRRL